MNKITLIFFYLAVFQNGLLAQNPTIQDCLGAIQICDRIYTENFVQPGDGNYSNEINEETTCGFPEEGSVWYTFTVDESGDFGFIITPQQLSDDYDWALFNITDASCNDIFDKSSLLVSCNAAGDTTGPGNMVLDCLGLTGATGATDFDRQKGGCNDFSLNESGYNTFNDLIPVTKGNIYALMISNFTQSGKGYTIDFGLTDVGVIDNQPAAISDIEFPEKCNDAQITIFFTEKIKSKTIERLNNFQLIGPKGESYSFSSLDPVNSPNSTKEFSMLLNEGLINNGTYTFSMTTDGVNHVLDNCDNPFPAGEYIFQFDLNSPELPSIELGNDTIICSGQPLILNAFNKEATYQWQNNSTSEIFIVEKTGDYSVTISNACSTVSDTRKVTLLDGPPIIEFGEDRRLCPKEEQLLDATNQEATYLWQDGSTNSTFNITQLGLYEVTVTNACGVANDNIGIDYLLPLEVNLQEDFFLCQPLALLSTREHTDASYRWNNGHTKRALEITESGIYILEAETVCEIQSDTVVVSTCETCKVYVPNIFSPNNDGINDLFIPFKEAGCELMNYQIQIFDRWGNQIFESNNPEIGWDGKHQNRTVVSSVYVWQMQYQLEQNGEFIAVNKIGDIAVLPSNN